MHNHQKHQTTKRLDITTFKESMSAAQQQNNDVKPINSDLVTVSNVAEIFNAAGFAFKKIGELVQQLDQQGTASAEQGLVNGGTVSGTSPGTNGGLSHWDTGDVEQFQTIITNFNDELSKLSNNLKNKMAARLQAEHTEKALERITPAETVKSE